MDACVCRAVLRVSVQEAMEALCNAQIAVAKGYTTEVLDVREDDPAKMISGWNAVVNQDRLKAFLTFHGLRARSLCLPLCF